MCCSDGQDDRGAVATGSDFTAKVVEEILSAIARSRTFDELPTNIAEACARLFDVEFCSLWRLHVDGHGARTLRLAAASKGMRVPETIAQEAVYILREDPEGKDADGLTGYVAQTRRTVCVNSFHEMLTRFGRIHRGKIDAFQYDGKPEQGFRNFCGVPLLCGDQVVGVLKAENRRVTNGFSPSDQATLELIGRTIAVAVHPLRLLDEHGRRITNAVIELSTALLQPFEPDAVMQRIVDTTADILGAEVCTLWLVDPDGRTLRLRAHHGFAGGTSTAQTYKLNWGARDDSEIEGVTAWIVVRGSEFWARSLEQLRKHPSWRGRWDRAQWDGEPKKVFKCLFGVPLRAMGQVRGALKVENKKTALHFSEADMAVCRIMASYVAFALELGRRLRTELLADMAHVIRSPIAQTVMNLSALGRELAEERPDLSACRQHVALLKRAALAIGSQARALAAITLDDGRGGGAETREEVSLATILDRQLNLIRQLTEPGREFRRVGWRDVRLRLGPREQTMVEIITYNILDNAVKFSSASSPIEIEMAAEPGRDVEVAFVDHGVGISSDDYAHVFVPGFRRRAKGWPDGTGMGLAAVANLLSRLGWDKRIESSPSTGTRFTFIIPAAQVKHGENPVG